MVATQRASSSPWVFGVFAAFVVVASAGFIAWLWLQFGGETATTAVDDIGEAVAAGVAAASCGFAAGRTELHLRRAWALLGASAAAWCAGEVAWSIYEVGFHVGVPFPSVADIGFIAAIPLAIAGILSFAHTSRGTSTGLRLWFDRAIVATSLTFLAWELGLGQIIFAPDETLFPRLVSLAYPVGDILVGTVLILAIRRATDETQGRLFLLLAGIAATAIADSAFAYLSANGDYGVIGSKLDAGWFVGYLVIALAAFWPSAARDRTAEERPVDIWQLVLPWTVIVVGGGVAVVQAVRGHPLDVYATALAAVVIFLVMISQVLAQHQSLTLLYRSRRDAATLNQVIVSAPLGVVRIDAHMRVIEANPTFAAMLGVDSAGLADAPLDRFVRPADLARVGAALESLSQDAASSVELVTEADRADGSSLWLRWTATAVIRPSGVLDYFLVMFEDASARRAADQLVASNLQVLERLNQLKSEFMTKVRHQFRTALVGIEGFSEYIRTTSELDAEEVRAMAGDIENEAHRLDQTIDEMVQLDTSAMESGSIAMTDLDFERLVREAASLVQMGTADHAIVLDLAQLPPVRGDADMLSQVVTSLLARAIDYSPAGAPVRLAAKAGANGVQLAVHDQGSAAPADLEAQLIGRGPDRPRASVRALTPDVGLPMAKQIVEMHGGRLWYVADGGTTWNIKLPAAPVAAPERAPSGLPGSGRG